VANPLNQQDLLLGSVDGNCYPSTLGLHFSHDGGSSWQRVLCMPIIYINNDMYITGDEPSVGYDRRGVAYAAGDYYDYTRGHRGVVAVQKSSNGIRWTKPKVALRGQSYPFETSMAVDTSVNSPWVNSVYVSGVMWSHHGSHKQVVVSHSTDSGVTWTQSAVDVVQKYPEQDFFTRMAVGKDGNVFASWMRCRGTHNSICTNNVAHMMFSSSTDGGNTWSAPQVIATVTTNWELPNSNQVRLDYYPVIAVDNSNGPNSGNLYLGMYTWTGTYLRAQVIRSTDGGKTWSKPVPLAPKSDTHDQFFPTVSVSPTGLVGVSWLDRRNDPANHDYQAFTAISTDGGKTFPNTQLTDAFSDPDKSGDDGWMGDYMGNTWAGNKFIAAWMDSSNGVDMQAVIGGVRLK